MNGLIADLSASAATSGSGIAHLLDNFGVRGDLLVAQIINFCLVTYLLYRFALKPVLQTVEARQKKISEGLQYAEEMKQKLEAAERERVQQMQATQEEAQKILERTKQESEAYLQAQKAAAEKKVTQILEQAQATIASERKQMMSEVRSEVVDLVVATTERVLQNAITPEMRTSLNERALESLKTEGKQ